MFRWHGVLLILWSTHVNMSRTQSSPSNPQKSSDSGCPPSRNNLEFEGDKTASVVNRNVDKLVNSFMSNLELNPNFLKEDKMGSNRKKKGKTHSKRSLPFIEIIDKRTLKEKKTK